MIRFCDREIVACSKEEIHGMSRGELIRFFIREGTTLMILVFDEEGLLIGSIAYHDVLKYMELEEYLNPKRFCISDTFWEEAREYFTQNEKAIIPVCNNEQQVLGFCYNNYRSDYGRIETCLTWLQDNIEDAMFIQEVYPFVEQVCISDCNEWAYQIYQLCLRKQIPVCLIGEKWEWFGYTTCKGIYDYPDYAKCYIYAEGKAFTRKRDNETNIFNEDLRPDFDFLLSMWFTNNKYMIYKIQSRFKEKGVELCNVMIPSDREVTFKTMLELAASRAGTCKVVETSSYRYLSDLQKKYLQIFYGEDFYEECLEKCNKNSETKKRINGRKELYYVDECLKHKRIYIIGPCITVAKWTKTEENLISVLQKIVGGYGYSVVACFIGADAMDWRVLKELSVRQSDILLFIYETYMYDERLKEMLPYLETVEIFDDEGREDWYPDMPMHMNAKGMKCLADYIYTNYLEGALQDKMKLSEEEALTYLQKGKLFADEHAELVDIYVQSVKSEQVQKGATVGSIVMNCNPFTYGHQYLIETAAKKVDYLYIFVVEENRSDYDFSERMKMVQDGTSHLANVIVVPSGNLILSYNTMPIYFEKSVKQEAKVDASLDLEIFGQWIAPKLDITYRFVGEEPFDKVTKQYNEQMQIVLSQYGIEVIEIPRKELEGEVVSASRVRKLIEAGKEKEAKKLVPESTWDVIIREEYSR